MAKWKGNRDPYQRTIQLEADDQFVFRLIINIELTTFCSNVGLLNFGFSSSCMFILLSSLCSAIPIPLIGMSPAGHKFYSTPLVTSPTWPLISSMLGGNPFLGKPWYATDPRSLAQDKVPPSILSTYPIMPYISYIATAPSNPVPFLFCSSEWTLFIACSHLLFYFVFLTHFIFNDNCWFTNYHFHLRGNSEVKILT